MNELILIDFSWLYNKYYFVASYSTLQENEGTKPEGEVEINLYRMLSQFLKLINKSYPNAKIFCVMDSPTSTLKNKEIFEGYKQNRDKEAKKEIYAPLNKIVGEMSKVLNSDKFSFLKAPSYEADQVIACTVKKFYNKYKVIIFSGDKDLIQLTSYPNTYISDKFEKGQFIIKEDKELFEKFKNSKKEDFTRISTNKRDILKYRSLKGDTSDNLSPVFPRIKDKEIVDIIKNYWIDDQGEYLTIERISDIIDDVRGDNKLLAEKLEANKDVWLRNYKVMDLLHVDDIKVKRLGR